jgi:hypothetical protein
VIVAIIQDRYYKNKEKNNNFAIETSKEEKDQIDEEILKEIVHFDESGKICNRIGEKQEVLMETKHNDKEHLDQTVLNHFYKSMIENNDKFEENLFIPGKNSNKLFEFNMNVLRYRLKKLYFHTKDSYIIS